MSRSEPTTDLRFCESQVIIKAKLSNGEVLRLGTAKLFNIPESDGNQYSYEAKIIRDSEVRTSTTQAANQMSAEAENVDKVLGLSINDINAVLTGAEVICSKVFAPIFSYNVNDSSPVFWFDGTDIVDTYPNSIVSSWKDKSLSNRTAVGSGILRWKKINGYNAVEFDSSRFMTIPGSFPLAQVFAVFVSPQPTFNTTGSIINSNPEAFSFIGGTSQFGGALPSSVSNNGNSLSAPFSLGNLTTIHILNIKTNSPGTTRSYRIGDFGGTNFLLSELIGFQNHLDQAQEQRIEHTLARKFGISLPYTPVRAWENKVLLVGQISQAEVDENVVSIRIVSDVAPNVAFIATRPVQANCPLVFKGRACGYIGPLTTCNKLYESDGGCSGRQNQHRYGGVVAKGELVAPIPGGIDTTIGYGGRDRGGDHFPTMERNREMLAL